MTRLLPLFFALLGLAAGLAAGHLLRPEEEISTFAGEEEISPGSKADEEPEYARFSNQFVVPVVRETDVAALVVMSIALEVLPGGTTEVFAREPRLRDSFLQVMFDHANAGGFDGAFTEGGTLALLRTGLLEVARQILGPSVRDVLITEVVRQEV